MEKLEVSILIRNSLVFLKTVLQRISSSISVNKLITVDDEKSHYPLNLAKKFDAKTVKGAWSTRVFTNQYAKTFFFGKTTRQRIC
jgi:hypothetical protein